MAPGGLSSENTNNGNASAPYSAGITCQNTATGTSKVDGTDFDATHPAIAISGTSIVREPVTKNQRDLDSSA